jgi:hypothetical protein
VDHWAALPKPPKIVDVIPTAQKEPVTWRYVTRHPADGWTKTDFDDSSWKEGSASFGTDGTPGAVVRTRWNNDDIWLRRVVALPDKQYPGLQFYVHHDEDVEIYVNGVLAGKESGFTTHYVTMDILPAALAMLKPSATISLSVHCHQTSGGQNIDVGLVSVTPDDGDQLAAH